MLKNHRYWITAAIAAALVMTACGGGESGDGQPAGSAQVKSATTAPKDEGAQTSSESESAQSSSSSESSTEETGSIPNLDANLGALKSYRARYTFSFEGKDEDGKESKGSLEFLQEYIAETKDQHTRMSGSGTAGNASNDAFETFSVGGVSYIYNAGAEGDSKCTSFSSSESASSPAAMFRPGDIIGGLSKAKLAERGVTVNGIQTDRYTFDETGIGFGVFSKGGGEAWLAQDGNYVVKYVGEVTGQVGLLGQNAEGTMRWDYSLESVNQLTQIELPAECAAQKPADDIPVPAGATDQAQFGGMITFKTTDVPDKVAEFYKAEMPGKGWTEGETTEMGEIRTLNYTKDDRSLSIMINKSDDGTTVIITERKGE